MLEQYPDSELKQLIVNYCTQQQQINQLSQEIKEADNASQTQFKRQLRKLKWEYKKYQNKLVAAFYQLPNLSKPRDKQYWSEYESLLNETVTEFCHRVCEDFEPQPEKSLTDSLAIWVNIGLRLKYKVIELTSSRRRSPNESLLDILIEVVNKSEGSFKFTDFTLQAELAKTKLSYQEAEEFLQKQTEKFDGKIIPGNKGEITYQFETGKVRQSAQIELNRAITSNRIEADATLGEDGKTLANVIYSDGQSFWSTLEQIKQAYPEVKTIGQKLRDYIEADSEKRLKNSYPRSQPDCNCQILILRCLPGFQDNQSSFSDVARESNVNRQALQSLWERHCFPLLCEIILELADTNKLSQYIESETEGKLRACYLKENPDCHAQMLAQRLLPLLKEKKRFSKELTAIAEEYNVKRDKLLRHWRLKCLPLLSKIAVDLSEE
ncbi:MAG: hypothetical protein AB4426_16450 [Xenococcaceae cyanobacterium]